MAINQPAYAESSDVRDIYPNIDKYDLKVKLYDFVADNSYYVHYNSGVVNNFFIDGKDLQTGRQTISSTADTRVDNESGYSATATSIVVDDGDALTAATYIKIGSEILFLVSKSTNTLAVTRGHFGTVASAIVDNAAVYNHFQPSVNGDWLYDSDNDFLITKQGSDPSDNLCESGEDYASIFTDQLYKASRYLDSYLDPSMPRQAWKNDEDKYDYIIVRTTAQICANFLISAHDPENEDALRIKEEYEATLDKINEGGIKLGFEVSADSSQGILREIYSTGSLKPVDLRGKYRGGVYDKIRIEIETAGVIGTAKMGVWVKGNDKLGINKGSQVVTEEIITGEYQSLSGGLQIRFGASTPTKLSGSTTDLLTASAVEHDVWEVEVWGVGEELNDARGIKSANLTRS